MSTVLAIAVAFVLAAMPADAHVRWLVTDFEALQCACHVTPAIQAACVAVAALAVVAAGWIQRRWRLAGQPVALDAATLAALRGILAIWLCGAACMGFYLCPDVRLGGLSGAVLGAGQIVAALLLICPWVAAGTAGGLALTLFIGGLALAPPTCLVETLPLAGLGAALALHARPRAFHAARFCTGAALALGGLQEKILEPSLSVAFLQRHAWNFAAQVGMKDIQFVLLAGCAEMAVGAMVAFGVLDLMCGLGVLGLMTVTAALLGPAEMLAHLPYLVVCVLMVLHAGVGWRHQLSADSRSE